MLVSHLNDDMQDLLQSIFEDAGVDLPEQIPLRNIPLDCFPDVALADGVHDGRGEPHARSIMASSTWLPPLIVHGNTWMDGRHRVWAARQMDKVWMTALDLADLIPAERLNSDALRIGTLSAIDALSEQQQYRAYAAQFIEAAPSSIGVFGDVDDISQLQWVACTLTRAGLVSTGADLVFPQLKPGQSDLARPIVMSKGDAEQGEGPLEVWDGVHRIASAWRLQCSDLPTVMGFQRRDGDDAGAAFLKEHATWLTPCDGLSVLRRVTHELQCVSQAEVIPAPAKTPLRKIQ